MDLLNGLDKFGLESLQTLSIYDDKGMPTQEGVVAKPFNIDEYTYNKNMECPVCDNNFATRVLRLAKLSPVATDFDLRPIYKEPIQPLFYDIAICPKCGWSALSQVFKTITESQAKLIKETISPGFKYVEYPPILTAEMSIERYKLALANAIVRKALNNEKAYICMKIAWMYRSIKDKTKELLFIAHAYKGFLDALSNERPPFLGLDIDTVSCIIASQAKTLGYYKDALKMTSRLLTSRSINPRLKDRSLDLKHELMDQIRT